MYIYGFSVLTLRRPPTGCLLWGKGARGPEVLERLGEGGKFFWGL